MSALKLLTKAVLPTLLSLIAVVPAEDEVEQCQQLVDQPDIVTNSPIKLQINCFDEGNVSVLWIDNLVVFADKIIIGYLCFTNDSQDTDDEMILYENIDTSGSTLFTTTTNASSCTAKGCFRQQLGRGQQVWNNLNTASCYFLKNEDNELMPPISPSSIIHLTENTVQHVSSNSSIPVSVIIYSSIASNNENIPTMTPSAEAGFNLQQAQIIIAITLTCSVLFFTFVAVILFVSTGYYRKRVRLGKNDADNDTTDCPEMIAYTVPSLSPSSSIMTIFDYPQCLPLPAVAAVHLQSTNKEDLSSSTTIVVSQNEDHEKLEVDKSTVMNAVQISEHITSIIFKGTTLHPATSDSDDTVEDTSIPLSSSSGYISISDTYYPNFNVT